MGLDEVPVEADLGTVRFLALFTPEGYQLLDVVLLSVVVLELQPSFKLNVARFAPKLLQVRVLVVSQVLEHEAAHFALLFLLAGVLLSFLPVLLQTQKNGSFVKQLNCRKLTNAINICSLRSRL